MEKILYKITSSAQNRSDVKNCYGIQRGEYLESTDCIKDGSRMMKPFLVSSGSSPLRLDSVDRPCGDVSVTGSASRAARKSRCAVLKVVIHDYKCQY